MGPNGYTKHPSEDDHGAAYLNALMWYITGDKAHANKSIEILNVYSKTLKLIGPNDNDDPLYASLQGSMLANAAEIIKHTCNEVKEDDISSWETMFRTIFISVLDTFLKAEPYTDGNWGAAATKAYMALGIFMEDDCGQMSAWYIFSALGFYPVNPCGGGEYILGAPQINRMTISLPEGKVFTVEANNLSKENKYVESVSLNGRRINNFRISHQDIMDGRKLTFTMSDSPEAR